MINKETLDSMLCIWASYKTHDFDDISWPKVSMSGKIMEAAKLGMFAYGTNNKLSYDRVPGIVDTMQKAMIQLPLLQQHIIKAEYIYRGAQRCKAKKLNLSVNNYRAKLCRARLKLRQII